MEHLQTMGFASSSGMGLVPISFTEIQSYMQTTNTELTPSEVKLLKKMSQSYVSESNNRDPHAFAPYIDTAKIMNFDNSDRIKQSFANL